MKTYLVGGAVRDRLLGQPVTDRDWLVTGATDEQLIALGYRRVGQDFPVFLHPDTHEEHALPRAGSAKANERQRVEDDLTHRDLTINAMALTDGDELIDPLNGQRDIHDRLLRHTPAFAQDPVRILRLARLAARLAPLGFRIAPQTQTLVKELVGQGALENLVAERVWSEIQRGLEETDPVHFIQHLRALDALAVIMPELERLFGVPQPAHHHPEIDTGQHSLMVLAQACRLSPNAEVRLAALLHDLGKGLTPQQKWPRHIGHEKRGSRLAETLCQRLRTPKSFSELARLSAQYHTHCHRALELKPTTLLRTLEALDALRRPQRFEQFLQVCEADFRGRLGFQEKSYPQADRFRLALQAARQVDSAQIARGCQERRLIHGKIQRKRTQAISNTLERLSKQPE